MIISEDKGNDSGEVEEPDDVSERSTTQLVESLKKMSSASKSASVRQMLRLTLNERVGKLQNMPEKGRFQELQKMFPVFQKSEFVIYNMIIQLPDKNTCIEELMSRVVELADSILDYVSSKGALKFSRSLLKTDAKVCQPQFIVLKEIQHFINVIVTAPNLSAAIQVLLLEAFTTEELTSCSVMGARSMKGETKPALDHKKRSLIEVLLSKAFKTEELTSCSVMGARNMKGETKPALDHKKRSSIKAALLEKYDSNLTTLRNLMRDRLKLMRKRHL
ncbi:uncharacterized protein LOC123534895 [Mercenaria mercenaria]|uniref:uncharacterized protein LOC123534895 n=1 Tax=Mercenaria mercenaria TaxID=6596 RepID=UPI00234F4CAD|nr:uncharacterized protein LOC123534895 [Mercenaria mercenaria]